MELSQAYTLQASSYTDYETALQVAQLNMMGFTAFAFLGLDTTCDITKKWSHRVFKLGIASLVVPKLITIGPMATIDIKTSYILSAKAAVLAGATIEVKGLSAVIDLGRPPSTASYQQDSQWFLPLALKWGYYCSGIKQTPKGPS